MSAQLGKVNTESLCKGTYLSDSSCGCMPAGARQATRLRRRYLQAVLRQDAAFFDASAKSGALLQGLNEDTSAIQLAIGEKVQNSYSKGVLQCFSATISTPHIIILTHSHAWVGCCC